MWRRATKEGTSTSVERNLELEWNNGRRERGRRKLNAVAVIFCGPWLNVGGARVVVVGKSEVSQFRGDRGVGRRGVRG